MVRGLASTMLCNEPEQYSIRMKTSYTPLEVLFQAASIRWTIFGWPFRIRFETSVRDTTTRVLARVTTVTYHNVYLFLNLGKHRLVWNCDTFKNMVCSPVHGRWSPDEVDMCESAYKGGVTKVDDSSGTVQCVYLAGHSSKPSLFRNLACDSRGTSEPVCHIVIPNPPNYCSAGSSASSKRSWPNRNCTYPSVQ